jgi:cytochrome b561
MAPNPQTGSDAARRAGAAAVAAPAYTPVARLLHWTTAALVLALIPIGLIMVHLVKSGPTQDFLFALHESLGITVMAVVYFRIAYRLTHPPVPLPPEIPDFYRIAGQSVHYLLYGLLAVQPILGWIGTSAYRAPIHFFWVAEVPPIWPENRAFSDLVFWIHLGIGLAIAGLVCLHAGAGLFHHFIRRDVVLMRMVRG